MDRCLRPLGYALLAISALGIPLGIIWLFFLIDGRWVGDVRSPTPGWVWWLFPIPMALLSACGFGTFALALQHNRTRTAFQALAAFLICGGLTLGTSLAAQMWRSA